MAVTISRITGCLGDGVGVSNDASPPIEAAIDGKDGKGGGLPLVAGCATDADSSSSVCSLVEAVLKTNLNETVCRLISCAFGLTHTPRLQTVFFDQLLDSLKR
jgi:hypothetical protein